MKNDNRSIQMLMKEVAVLRRENLALQEQITAMGDRPAISEPQSPMDNLTHSESLFQMLVESLPFSILMVDQQGIITTANSRVMTDFGYQPEELINQPVEMLLPPSLGNKHRKIRKKYAKNPTSRPMGNGMDLYAQRKNTEMFPVDVALTPVMLKNQQMTLVTVVDVTERHASETAVKKSAKRIRALYEVTSNYNLDENKRIANALKVVADLLGMALGIQSRITDDLYVVENFYALDGGLEAGQRFSFQKTYCQITFQEDDVVAITDMGASAYSKHPCYKEFHLESYIGVPVKIGGQRYGTINFASPHKRAEAFDEQDFDLLRLLADWVGATIGNRQAREALRNSEQRLEMALEGTELGTWDWNVQTGDVVINDRWIRMLGYASGEIGSKVHEWEKLLHPDDAVYTSSALQAHFDGETPLYESEHRLKTRSGEWRWILNRGKVFEWADDGKPLRMLGTHLDITDRKIMEEELRQQRNQLSATLSAIPDLIFRIDKHGTYLDVHIKDPEVLLAPPEELIGKKMGQLLPEKIARQSIKAIRKALTTGIVQQIEYAITIPKKGLMHFEARIAPCGESETVVILRNITKRKQIEAKVVEYNRKLEAKNRELEEFSYIASHDLREPLRTITSYCELLEMDLGEGLSEDTREDIHFITDAAKRMDQLILNLLEYSRAGSKEITQELVDLNTCMDTVVADLSRIVSETNAHIEWDALPAIKGDPTLLKQVFQNLVSNSLKFHNADTPTVKISVQKMKSGNEIRVTDNGIGMKQRHLEQIFQPFRRLHSRKHYEGTGIGLSICKKIIERHGGKIHAESEEGKGTTFVIRL